jgi:hypothetical protein
MVKSSIMSPFVPKMLINILISVKSSSTVTDALHPRRGNELAGTPLSGYCYECMPGDELLF